MGLLELFNQVITEHGSSAIKQERIELFRERLAFADIKLADAANTIAALKDDKERMELDNQRLADDNNNLKRELDIVRKSLHDSLQVKKVLCGVVRG